MGKKVIHLELIVDFTHERKNVTTGGVTHGLVRDTKTLGIFKIRSGDTTNLARNFW